jgi:hypothetical protein
MGERSRNISADQKTNYLNRMKVKNDGFVDGTANTYIAKHAIVAVVDSSSEGQYIHVDEADKDADTTNLWIACYELRDAGEVTKWGVLDLDTSAATLKDPVYLGDAGVVTLTRAAGAPQIGIVVNVATLAAGGRVFIDLSSGESALDATPTVIADPGGANGTIPVTASGSVAITTAGVETGNLPDPTFEGQVLTLFVDGYVNTRTITAASPINVADNTIMTFGADHEAIGLVAITRGSGDLEWQVTWNDTVSLS